MADLYIQSSGYRLSLKQNMLLIWDSEKRLLRELPVEELENILIFGNVHVTTPLIRCLGKKGINLYYFTSVGRFLSCLDTYRESDFEKQCLQAKASFSEEFCLGIAREIIGHKLAYQAMLLKSYDEDGLLDESDFERFEEAIAKVAEARSQSEVLGYEGRIAKSYFYYLSLLVPKAFRFNGRSKRPARDPFNALLNLGYSILYSFFIGLIRKNGLSQGFAFVHKAHRHHGVLASDLMEEWRAVIVDDTVMQLLVSKRLVAEHFTFEDEACWLTAEGQAIFVRELKERMLEIHPYVVGDVKRYSFIYQADQQVKRLIRAMGSLNPDDYGVTEEE